MNIMVIDDDAGSLRGMTMALRILGYQCEAFANPAEALHSFAFPKYNAVISDLRMQPIDGIQLMLAIQAIKPMTPVIIVSGYADGKSIREAFERGATAFLEKPLDAMELAKVLDNVATNN